MKSATSKELFARYQLTRAWNDWSDACRAEVRETTTVAELEKEREQLRIKLVDIEYQLSCHADR